MMGTSGHPPLWSHRIQCPPCRAAALAHYEKRDAATSLVQQALKMGRLIRQPCEECGTTNRVHAHHDNYDLPVVVRWLCSLHHKQYHKNAAAYWDSRPIPTPRKERSRRDAATP